MGNRLTEDEPRQTEPKSYGDIFDELFPHYLLMGMTPEQYWDGEYGLKKAYREAYKLQKKMEQMAADRSNWYMGQYIMSALRGTPLLVAGLNVKRGAQLPEYPKKPLLEEAEEQKKKEVRKKKEEDQAKLAMALMQAAFTRFNKRFEQKQAEAKQAVKAGP